jgi:arylsulfatase A-like enzyme
MADSDRHNPNIVFIMADDMGYGDPGCYGATKIPTPNMDRMAGEGMRFTDAHSASAVCTPSRYGVMTGRYAWRTRLQSGVLWGYSDPLIEPGRITVADMLRAGGYATGAFGKWHLGLGWQRTGEIEIERDEDGSNIDHTVPLTDNPTTHGFDYYWGIAASPSSKMTTRSACRRWTKTRTRPSSARA